MHDELDVATREATRATHDVDDIVVALGGDQTDLGAAALDDGISADGGAVGKHGNGVEQLRQVQPDLGRRARDGFDHTFGKVGRRGRCFGDRQLTAFIHQHAVGERAADIEATKIGTQRCLPRAGLRARLPGSAYRLIIERAFKTKPSLYILASKPRPSAAKAQPGTAERILDAAEKRFAECGYDGVSLRQITREAGVELALANYHFGPKLDLFRAVVRRRAEALNAERMALLEALNDSAGIEDLIHAFTAPFLEKSMRGGQGWKDYARVIAQTANSPRWTADLMAAEFDPVARAFITRVRRVFPQARDTEVYWCFHFLLGAMTITFAETGRVDVLSAGKCKAADLDAIHARMIPFLAAGFRALL